MTERVDVRPVPEADAQIGLLLAMLDDGTNEWRGELGKVSPEIVGWQPFPGGHSIGALLLHIADVEASWLHQVGAGRTRSEEELARLLSKETQQYEGVWPVPPPEPLSWFLAQHDEIRARTRQIVSTWEDPALAQPRDDAEFTRRWLLHHVLTHKRTTAARPSFSQSCTGGRRGGVGTHLRVRPLFPIVPTPCSSPPPPPR